MFGNRLKQISRGLAAISIVAVSSVVFSVLAAAPAKQNLLIRSGSLDRVSVAEQRSILAEIRNTKPDPFLAGHLSMTEARLLGELGRREEAAATYRRAAGQSVYPHEIVEAGLYQLEVGDFSEARRILSRAAAFSSQLITDEVPPGLRDEIRPLRD